MIGLAFIDNLGGGEFVWVLLVVLLLFGGEKLPGLARGLGRAVNEFKRAKGDVEREIQKAMREEPTQVRIPEKIKNPASAPDAPALSQVDDDGLYPETHRGSLASGSEPKSENETDHGKPPSP